MAVETAALFDPWPLRSLLLGSTVVPVYRRSDGEVGRLFVWEQRYWLAALGITDGTKWRKYEKRRGWLDVIVQRWDLCPEDFIFSDHFTGQGFSTVVIGSHVLLGWLMRMFAVSWRHCHCVRARNCAGCLNGFLLLAEEGFAQQPGACVITVDGVDLHVRPELFRLDLTPLLGPWPDIGLEWQTIRAVAPWTHMSPFPVYHLVSMMDALMFVEARIRFSDEGADVSTLLTLRSGVVGILVAFFEVGVSQSLETSAQANDRSEISDLYGPNKRRRLRQSVVGKMQLIRKLGRLPGSKEVIASCEQRGGGLSIVLARAKTGMYTTRGREGFDGCGAASAQWDEGSHGGLSINMGALLNVDSDHAAYLVPGVA